MKVKVLVTQSCSTLCNSMDCSTPGSCVHGVSWAWIPSGWRTACNARDTGDADLIPGLGRSPEEGNGNSLQYFWPEKSQGQKSLVGYSPWGHRVDMTEWLRVQYWSRLPFPTPGDLPDPGIKPGSPALQADSLPSEPPGKFPRTMETPWKC